MEQEKINALVNSINGIIKEIALTAKSQEYNIIQVYNNSFLALQALNACILNLLQNNPKDKQLILYKLVTDDLIKSYTLITEENQKANSVVTYRISRYCEEFLKFVFTENDNIRWMIKFRTQYLDNVLSTSDLIRNCVKERRKLNISDNEDKYKTAFINIYLDGEDITKGNEFRIEMVMNYVTDIQL